MPDRTSSARRSRSRRRPWYGRPRTYVIGVVSIVALALVGLGGAYAMQYRSAEIPSVDELAVPDPSLVFDSTGERVATLDPTALHRNVRLGDLPAHVPHAVLAAEDRSFREHDGYSPSGIVRAAWANITNGSVVQGASTITQQYVELAVEDVDDSLAGKFREVAIAAKLDDQLDKDRILEMYLNAVPLGRGARGIEAAARTYFGVSADELDLNQAATLAGMIAAPSAYDPGSNPEDATARRNYVLRGLVEQGWLDATEADRLADGPLPQLRTDPLVRFGADAYFLDAVRTRVPELLEDPDRDPSVELAIHTTLDRRMQSLAVKTLDEQLAEVEHTGAIVTVDAASGAVRALVGGRDYAAEQYNVATRGRRQPGSSFKPFTLAAFIAQGNAPDSEVDAPRTVEVPSAGNETAEIGNYTQRGYGEVTVREATRRSINTAYMNLAEEVGYDTVVDMANALGVEQDLPEVPTITLGAGGVSPLDMASAYATFAAQGVRHERHLITRIETLDGDVLYEHEVSGDRVLGDNVSAVVTDVLTDVVESGTGVNAQIDRPVAGKTGTTNDYRDAWFVGYTPRLATAVWIGNLDNSPMDRVTGGSLPAETWATYSAKVLDPAEPVPFPDADLDALEDIELDGVDEEERRRERLERERREASEEPTPTPTPVETVSPTPSPVPSPTATQPDPQPTPTQDDDVPAPLPEPTEGPTSDPSPTSEPSSEPSPTKDPSPSDEPSPTSEPTGEPSPSSEPTSEPSPSSEPTSEPSPSDGSTSEPSPSPEPSPDGSTSG